MASFSKYSSRLTCNAFPKTSNRLSLQRNFSKTSVRNQGRTAIVTGSSQGIGRAIALRIARDGYDVCVNDIPANEAACEKVVTEIQRLGRKACTAVADVTDLGQVERMIQRSVNELGPLNTMIANAGIAQVKPVLDVTPSDIEALFRVNVFGVHNCFQAAAKQLISQGNCQPNQPGKMLTAASISAFKPYALFAPYTASKFAVRGLMQSYAVELAEHHITVNAYAPGIVDTPMWEMIDGELGERKAGGGARKGEMMERTSREIIALGRTSEPEDVASLVGFLAGPDSDYVTGQTQLVDGGVVFT